MCCRETNRLAGLQCDTVRHDAWILQFRHSAIRQVARTFACAARQQNDIGGGDSLPESLAQHGEVIAGYSESERFTAKLPHGVGENLSVGVVDFGPCHWLAWCDDLVTSRKDSHSRFAPYLHAFDADSGQHSGVAARQYPPETKHCFAGGDVGSGERYSGTGSHGPGHAQFVIAHLGVLDHDNRIGTARNHSSGCDGYSCSLMNYGGRHNAGVDRLIAQLQAARYFFGCSEGAVRNNGEAVDVRTVKRGYIDRRYNVGRQNAAERSIERHAFDASRCGVYGRAKAPLRFVAIENVEELFLFTHRAKPALQCLA